MVKTPKGNLETEPTGGCWGGGGIANFMGSSSQLGKAADSRGDSNSSAVRREARMTGRQRSLNSHADQDQSI